MSIRILLVNSVCKTGSTGKLTYDLHRRLKAAGYKSVVCYGKGEVFQSEPDLIRITSKIEYYHHAAMSRLTGMSGCYSNKATTRLLTVIDEFKPDVVHLFNLHGYYVNEFRLLDWLKNKRINTVYSMLDEYPYMGKCCYSYGCENFKTGCARCPEVRSYPVSWFFDTSNRIFRLKKKAYDGFNNIVFTAPGWVIERARSSALLKNKKFAIIDEAINLDDTFYARNTSELRERLGIGCDKRIILTVAQFTNSRKGGIHYLELAKYLERENMCFIHVGYDGGRTNLPKNVIPIAYVGNQDELASYYSLADLFVCTSLADTMPNVCLEALACGTPLCGFSVSGTPYVATSEFGIFTPEGNIEELARVVKNTPKKSNERSSACRQYAEMRYSGRVFLEKILRIYETALS